MAKVTIIPAKEAKNRFGELLEVVQRQPVIITKKGRPVARVYPYADAQRFEEVEDELWLERAQSAHIKGTFLDEAASMDALAAHLTASHAHTRTRKTRR